MKLIDIARKLIYIQVLLGIFAYGVAEANAMLLILATTFGWLSWFLVEAEGGRPLPRWIINLSVLLVLLWLVYSHVAADHPLILSLGQFILFIQLFKLYEGKSNRDWGQLIVLSLMLMVCASIISADILFGILLVFYLGVGLFAILVFQLKVSRDTVQAVNHRQAPQNTHAPIIGAPVTHNYRRHFNMLAMTAGTAAIVLSTAFFLLMPRGHGSGVFGNWEGHSQRSVSGFTDEINLSGGGRMSSSRLPVMNVAFARNGREAGSGGQAFLLRGTALDHYDSSARRWVRSNELARGDVNIQLERGQDGIGLAPFDYDQRFVLTQFVTMRAHQRDMLFASFTPVRIEINDPFRFNPADQTISVPDSDGSTQYVVHSLDTTGGSTGRDYRRAWHAAMRRGTRDGYPTIAWSDYARTPVATSDRVRDFTQELIATAGYERDPEADTAPEDRLIAEMVSRHLQTRLAYSLDIPPVQDHDDPIEAFLFEYQRGHCEFFASAMCAMLRSLGIRSRVVTGFRATEYNAVGGYYVVRARNAHAWVEVWVGDEGWRTYDPSPPTDLAAFHEADTGLFAALRDLYDYVEFQWINRIISYDSMQQRTVMSHLNQGVGGFTSAVRDLADAVRNRVEGVRESVVGPLGFWGVLIVSITMGLFVFTYVGNLSRRRFMSRFGLGRVDRREQKRLAKQLGFYFSAVEVVEQAGYERPDWQTPRSFAVALADEAPHRFGAFLDLTDLFYEIRFGGREITEDRLATANHHLAILREQVRT